VSAIRGTFPAPAIGRLEERAGTGVFEACLQAQRSGSGECLPHGRHAVASNTISVFILSRNGPPLTKIRKNSTTPSPNFGEGIRNAPMKDDLPTNFIKLFALILKQNR